MSSEPISNVDLALLRMDVPNNLMIITGLMIFDSPLSVDSLKDRVEHSLLRHRRFRQRVIQPVFPLKRPYWEDDPDFNLESHIEKIELPLPAEQALLEYLIGELMSIPLDPARPLWKFYLVEHYGQGSALIARLHHSIADGIALMRVLLSMAETQPGAQLAEAQIQEHDGKASSQRRWTHELIRAGSQALQNPIEAIDNARQGADMAIAMGRFVLRLPDPKTSLKGKLGPKKLAVWSRPLSLGEIKRIGHAFSATVNDVLLSTIAGALRNYLLQQGETINTGKMHSFVPVNLRPQEMYGQLGNQFGLVYLYLPIEIEDPVERLYALKQNMDELKASAEAAATFGLFYLMGMAPRFPNALLSIFDSKGTAVTTNVPGPQQQLYLAGAPINTLMAWVPKSGHVGTGISILSYNGKAWLGVTTDEGLVPDPQCIVDLFGEQFEALKARADEPVASRRQSVAPMLARLDEAMQTLDKILEGSQDAKTAPEQASRPGHCQAVTRLGRPCKNLALPGEAYCRVHLK